MQHYILGNEINQLLERLRKQPSIENAVLTRAQAKLKNESAEEILHEGRDEEISLLDELKDEGEIDLPEAKGGETVTLVNLSRGEFKEKQLSNPTLSSFLTKRGINPTKNIVWKEKFYSGW